MMRTSHEALIRATPEAVFTLAADPERWVLLDPAYRWCRVLERSDTSTLFEMAGRIRGWPARWVARCDRDPAHGRLTFLHLEGITRAMRVEWALQPVPGGTRVRITHDLTLTWPVIGRLVADYVVGPLFIDWIARRTLTGVQHMLEMR